VTYRYGLSLYPKGQRLSGRAFDLALARGLQPIHAFRAKHIRSEDIHPIEGNADFGTRPAASITKAVPVGYPDVNSY